MCHLYAFLANEPTQVECSLVAAQNERLRRNDQGSDRPRASGWGVVCYDAQRRWRCPSLVKRTNAAIENTQFNPLAAATYSRAVVAHTRQATVGSNSTLNAHPFTFDEWTFAHHGTVPDFDKRAPHLESELSERFANCRLGETDSELLFLSILSRLHAEGLGGENLAQRSSDVIHTLVTMLESIAQGSDVDSTQLKLNFVLTNGEFLVAVRLE